MSKIKAVTNPVNGQLITWNKKGDFGSIRLETTTVTSTNGVFNPSTVTAFTRFPKSAEKVVMEMLGIVGNPTGPKNEKYVENSTDRETKFEYNSKVIDTDLEGVIQVQESFEPFYVEGVGNSTRTQDPKINPRTQEVFMKDGKPVFRQTVFLTDTKASKKVFGVNERYEKQDGSEGLRFVPEAIEKEEVVSEGAKSPTPATPEGAFEAPTA